MSRPTTEDHRVPSTTHVEGVCRVCGDAANKPAGLLCWRCRHARRKVKKITARQLNHRRKLNTAASRAYRWILLGDLCSYCQARPATTIDHIVPVSKGGRSHVENLTGSCQSCNQAKASTDLLTFFTRLCAEQARARREGRDVA